MIRVDYIVDESGNFIVDESGNYIVGVTWITVDSGKQLCLNLL